MRKIIFRADAGPSTGYGHFIRSLALADYLKGNFRCFFTSFNSAEPGLSAYQLEEISKVCAYLPLPAFNREEFDREFLSVLSGDEIVVLDNYYFSDAFRKEIKNIGCTLVCIDDRPGITIDCDMLLTGMPLTRNDFNIPASATFIGGLSHLPLRSAFLQDFPERDSGGKINRVTLAVGGADPYRLTDSIADIILSTDPCINLDIIAGDTVQVSENDRVKIHRRLSAKDIALLFSQSDIGIFPSSTISVEALACRLPVAAFWFVDNQNVLYNYGTTHHLFQPLGNPLFSMPDFKAYLLDVLAAPTQKAPSIDFNKGKNEIISRFLSL